MDDQPHDALVRVMPVAGDAAHRGVVSDRDRPPVDAKSAARLSERQARQVPS
jgi:hypothetical protein